MQKNYTKELWCFFVGALVSMGFISSVHHYAFLFNAPESRPHLVAAIAMIAFGFIAATQFVPKVQELLSMAAWAVMGILSSMVSASFLLDYLSGIDCFNHVALIALAYLASGYGCGRFWITQLKTNR